MLCSFPRQSPENEFEAVRESLEPEEPTQAPLLEHQLGAVISVRSGAPLVLIVFDMPNAKSTRRRHKIHDSLAHDHLGSLADLSGISGLAPTWFGLVWALASCRSVVLLLLCVLPGFT